MSTKMSPGFALFNCHVNNAEERAFAEMRAMGSGAMADEVQAVIDAQGGIMGLFSVPVTAAIGVFIGMVCVFVNEDREPVAETPVEAG